MHLPLGALLTHSPCVAQAGTTALATWLNRLPKVHAHPYELHFWDAYPAYEWHAGDVWAMGDEAARRLREAQAVAAEPLRHDPAAPNGTSLCKRLVERLAPLGVSEAASASTASVCAGARATLAAAVLSRHGLRASSCASSVIGVKARVALPAPHTVHSTPPCIFPRCTAVALCAACVAQAPSYISEPHVPLRISACLRHREASSLHGGGVGGGGGSGGRTGGAHILTAMPWALAHPRARLLVVLRDPSTRTFSARTRPHTQCTPHAVHLPSAHTADSLHRDVAHARPGISSTWASAAATSRRTTSTSW